MSFLASMAGGIGEGMQQTGDMFAKKALVEAQAARDESLMRLGIQLREESEERMDAKQWERTQKRAPIIAKMETQAKIDSTRSLLSQLSFLTDEQRKRIEVVMNTGVDLFAPEEREKWTTEDRKFWNEMYTEEFEAIKSEQPGTIRQKFNKFIGGGEEPLTEQEIHIVAKTLADQRFGMFGTDPKPGRGTAQPGPRVPASGGRGGTAPPPEEVDVIQTAVNRLVDTLIETEGSVDAAITRVGGEIADPGQKMLALHRLRERAETNDQREMIDGLLKELNKEPVEPKPPVARKEKKPRGGIDYTGSGRSPEESVKGFLSDVWQGVSGIDWGSGRPAPIQETPTAPWRR